MSEGDRRLGRGAEQGHLPVPRKPFPTAQQLHARVKQLNDYPKYSSPSRKGPYYFFSKNDGLQNQSVLYIQKGLTGTPEVLLDPEHVRRSADDQARRVRAVGGREVRGLRHLQGRLRLAAVQGDGAGDEEDAARHARLGQGLGRRLARRRLLLQPLSGAGPRQVREGGDQRGSPRLLPQGRHAAVADRQVYQDAANPQRFNIVDTTEDERFALLTVSDRGKGKDGNALFVRDLVARRARVQPGHPQHRATTPTTSSTTSATSCWSRPTTTRRTAASSWSIRASPDEANWKAILPESPEPLAERQHGGRQDLRALSEGRDDEGVRLQPGRHARERSRAAGPRRRRRASAATATTRSCSTPSTR